ncbi:ankyrin repeat and SOCS box protein 9-like [Hoplias malabaricus]|uniref:ankyrin repeat and SOCS box protein 9-like n=1 Tax=Hoplias malabaricus TaxID=27720 RepID=UPI0034633866
MAADGQSVVFFSNSLMTGEEADWAPIHDAAFNGRLLALRSILQQGVSANLSTLDGVTPLHAACQHGHAACARLLIEHGANVNSSTLGGSTPLLLSRSQEHVNCVNLLLDHGAQPQS